MIIPVALTVAGSDSGGGAGIQADLKTFFACGVHGASAVTSVTFQNTLEVRGRCDLPPDAVREQMAAILDDLPVDAAKTGMLANAPIIRMVARTLSEYGVDNLVVDPVMVSTSGHALLDEEAVEVLTSELFPLATLVTPNLHEAARLSGLDLHGLDDFARAAERILAMGPYAVVIKGGHFEADGGQAVDLLFTREGGIDRFSAPRRAGVKPHGSGCVFSAAIAAHLARGDALPDAVRKAKRVVTAAIERSLEMGRGSHPVHPPSGVS
jgi:hydroxymethylpyrimidine kinase/phosphomethylpyrimidine kinase